MSEYKRAAHDTVWAQITGHGIEQDMRPTFKTYAIITTRSGVIASNWMYGQTDNDVLHLQRAASNLTNVRTKPVTSATAYDELNERYGAYRWTYEGYGDYFTERVNVTVWAVREYK